MSISIAGICSCIRTGGGSGGGDIPPTCTLAGGAPLAIMRWMSPVQSSYRRVGLEASAGCCCGCLCHRKVKPPVRKLLWSRKKLGNDHHGDARSRHDNILYKTEPGTPARPSLAPASRLSSHTIRGLDYPWRTEQESSSSFGIPTETAGMDKRQRRGATHVRTYVRTYGRLLSSSPAACARRVPPRAPSSPSATSRRESRRCPVQERRTTSAEELLHLEEAPEKGVGIRGRDSHTTEHSPAP